MANYYNQVHNDGHQKIYISIVCINVSCTFCTLRNWFAQQCTSDNINNNIMIIYFIKMYKEKHSFQLLNNFFDMSKS